MTHPRLPIVGARTPLATARPRCGRAAPGRRQRCVPEPSMVQRIAHHGTDDGTQHRSQSDVASRVVGSATSRDGCAQAICSLLAFYERDNPTRGRPDNRAPKRILDDSTLPSGRSGRSVRISRVRRGHGAIADDRQWGYALRLERNGAEQGTQTEAYGRCSHHHFGWVGRNVWDRSVEKYACVPVRPRCRPRLHRPQITAALPRCPVRRRALRRRGYDEIPR